MPPSAQTSMRVVSIGHDIVYFSLVTIFVQQLSHSLKVERRIVCIRHHILDVLHLEIDVLKPCHPSLRVSNPQLLVNFSIFPRWYFNFAENDISRKPGLNIKHVECEVIILHAKVVNLGVVFKNDAFPEVVRVHHVVGN